MDISAIIERAFRGRDGARRVEEGCVARCLYTTASSARTVERLNRDSEWPEERTKVEGRKHGKKEGREEE